jgi:DNA-binding NarL/FixJ family response regulator
MIRVFITDDHPIVLEGIKNLLSGREDIDLAALCSSGEATLKAFTVQEPDVLLLDINLPDISGVELCKQIRKRYKTVKIIALSVHNERPVIGSMLQHGINGYVQKNAFGDEIINAIHRVMEDEIYFCSQTREVMESKEVSSLAQLPKITRREKEILQEAAKGNTTAQTAQILFISTHTVESHRKNLMEKFEVNNMASVIKLAMEYQLL